MPDRFKAMGAIFGFCNRIRTEIKTSLKGVKEPAPKGQMKGKKKEADKEKQDESDLDKSDNESTDSKDGGKATKTKKAPAAKGNYTISF